MPLTRFPQIPLVRSHIAQGLSALLDLALPPVCRLCAEPVGEGEDFCGPCHTALAQSESVMRNACRKCGFPQPRWGPSAMPPPTAGRSGAEEGDEAGPRRVPETGISETGISETGISETGISETGISETGTSETGTSETGISETGISETGARPVCAVCRRLTFEFDAVVPLWIYQERVRDAIVAAKFAHRSPLGDALGRRLGARVKEALSRDLPQLVTFVPSHPARQIRRGGIGTQVIAQAVARAVEVPCRPLLKTTRQIAKQAWLDDVSRVENVRDAFRLKKGYAFAKPPEIANHHILLVEDVLTTGATANEVARVLRAGDARRVTLAVVARAIRRD